MKKKYQFPLDALEYAYPRYPVIVKKDLKVMGQTSRNIHIKLKSGLTLSLVKKGMDDEVDPGQTEILIINENGEFAEIDGGGNTVEVVPDDNVINVLKALEGLTGDLVYVPLNYLLSGGEEHGKDQT